MCHTKSEVSKMISIAMTTYNGEKYLCEQLDSILSQTIHDFELIVCDDCSTDATVQILRKYENNDNRIKVFVNEENLGFKRNFEKAIGFCSGEYIALSDQDDIWLPEHLEILINNIDDFDLVGANAVLIDTNGNEVGVDMLDVCDIEDLPKTQDGFEKFLMHNNIFQGCACLVRKRLLSKCLPIPANVKFHDWWFAIVANSQNGVNWIKIPILQYRQHGKNVTENNKYSVIQRTKNFFSKRKKKSKNSYLLERISLLLEYKRFSRNPIECENAIIYYKNRLKKSIKALPYFIRNYEDIYHSRHKKWGGVFMCKMMNLFI